MSASSNPIPWRRVLGLIGLSGLLAGVATIFGAGRVAESTQNSLTDHESRLQRVEPRVEAVERAMSAIREGVDELRKDVRELRDFLMPRPGGR